MVMEFPADTIEIIKGISSNAILTQAELTPICLNYCHNIFGFRWISGSTRQAHQLSKFNEVFSLFTVYIHFINCHKLIEQRIIKMVLHDNASCYKSCAAYSAFSSLKKERIIKRVYKTRDLPCAAIFDYIAVCYNRVRRESHPGGVSTEAIEQARS